MATDNEKFNEFMSTLSIKEHRDMIVRITEECIVPRTKVYLWKSGGIKIAPIYKKIISQIAGRDIFE